MARDTARNLRGGWPAATRHARLHALRAEKFDRAFELRTRRARAFTAMRPSARRRLQISLSGNGMRWRCAVAVMARIESRRAAARMAPLREMIAAEFNYALNLFARRFALRVTFENVRMRRGNKLRHRGDPGLSGGVQAERRSIRGFGCVSAQ